MDLVRISVHEGNARMLFVMGSVRLVASLAVGYSEATSTGILSLFLVDAGLSVLCLRATIDDKEVSLRQRRSPVVLPSCGPYFGEW